MAASPTMSARTRLIREMGGALNGRNSNDQHTGSVSSFDPENEALNSTRQIENTTQQPLPNLRSTANNYRYYHPPGADFVIDTSAVAKHFRDFDEGSSDNSSMSIELGRALAEAQGKTQRAAERDDDSTGSTQNFVFSGPNGSLYELTGTPPIKPKTKSALRDTQKDRVVSNKSHRATANEGIQTTTVPANSKQNYRRPSVQSNENSMVDLQPTETQTWNKFTRFGAAKAQQQEAEVTPRRQTSKPAANMAVQSAERHAQRHSKALPNMTTTQQSFALPDLPNLSELVSGVWPDGTPVFSRSTPARARPAPARNVSSTKGENHLPVDSIPVPIDEKAIFASLQLLKEKVAQLETEKSEAESRAEQYENAVLRLKAQAQVQGTLRRSDSGLGSSDEEPNLRASWRKERETLHVSIKSLEDRLDKAERATAVSKIETKRVTQEKESLAAQLGVAFYNLEDVKLERDGVKEKHTLLASDLKALQAEVTELKKDKASLLSQVSQMTAQRQHDDALWQKKLAKLNANLGKRGSKDAMAIDEPRIKSKTKPSNANLGDVTRSRLDRAVDQAVQRSVSDGAAALAHTGQKGNVTAKRGKPDVNTVDIHSEAESTTDLEIFKRAGALSSNYPNDGVNEDSTKLTSLTPTEMAKLKKLLNGDDNGSRKRHSTGQIGLNADTQNLTHFSRTGDLPKRSSMRDITGTSMANSVRVPAVSRMTLDEDMMSKHRLPRRSSLREVDTTERSQDVKHSQSHIRRRRTAPGFEEMTSAFILPDITLKQPLNQVADIDMATNAHFDKLAPHNREKCTICSHVPIPIPFPASERVDSDNVDATLRPSQPPHIALATVLKHIEDNIVHLKLDLARSEALYRSHEPALGRRKRAALANKIAHLIKEIETKSEWVYSLYDVLEGHKDDFKGMEGEVEATLQSIGIDIDELRKNQQAADAYPAAAAAKKNVGFGLDGFMHSEGESDDEDLPWEGLSDTDNYTGRSRGSHGRSMRL